MMSGLDFDKLRVTGDKNDHGLMEMETVTEAVYVPVSLPPSDSQVVDSRSQSGAVFGASKAAPEIVDVNGLLNADPPSTNDNIMVDQADPTLLGQINRELQITKKRVPLLHLPAPTAPAPPTIKRKQSEDGTKLPKPNKIYKRVPKPVIEKALHRIYSKTAIPRLTTNIPLPPQHSVSALQFHRRLSPLKIANVFSTKIIEKPDIRYTLEVENRISNGRRYNFLRCQHAHASEHPSEGVSGPPPYVPGHYWCFQTEAPICGVTGDGFRVVAVCEDATVHVLDLKGCYALPPLIISSVPSKMSLNGPFLLVVTIKAMMHVWNIHTKKIVKTESLLPLINQPGCSGAGEGKLLDIAYVSVSLAGVPKLILGNGKSFMYSLDMGTWMEMSDLAPTTSTATNGDVSNNLQSDPLCKTTDIISQIKLRLASAIELENTDAVRGQLIDLAKSLAAQGLRVELKQLCEDLLGPTHSAAKASGNTWSPTIVGVNKREVLKFILKTTIGPDLTWQDLYCEIHDLLLEEANEAMDIISIH